MNVEDLKKKSAQVWVETVIYTLIGLAIIGVILALATPALSKNKDKLIIEQTMSIMNTLDQQIRDVSDSGPGNRRTSELSIKKGSMTINGLNNEIIYVLEKTELEYSEPGKEIPQGNIKILTEKTGNKEYNITLKLSYSSLDIDYLNNADKKAFTPASIPYRLSLTNNGTSIPEPGKSWVLVEEISG
jgi:type II secretory pathway pseudopilin PulG